MSKVNTLNKEFDTVKFFREVKEKISKETQNRRFLELKAYLNKRKLKLAK
jgi:hypothetical protein